MVKKLTNAVAEKFLSDAPPEKIFYMNGGRAVRNVEELSQAMEEMNEEQFSFHRNAEKNDFYNWILHVIGDVRLANELARAKTKETTLKKINQRVDSLKKIRGEQNGK